MKIDILQMELEQKLPHWLSKGPKRSRDDIRQAAREKHLNERRAAREAAEPPKQQD